MDQTDQALLDEVASAFETIGELLAACKFKAALTETMALAHQANRYLDEKAPWFQIKQDRERAATTVFVILRVIDSLKTLFTPFLPFTSQQLHEYLGYEGSIIGQSRTVTLQEDARSHLALRYDARDLQGTWKPSDLAPGQPLHKPKPLFRKLEPEIADQEMENMGA